MAWDPYATLGVSPDATQSELKRAYRLLAKKFHPDIRPNDKDSARRFEKIGAAFALLGDPSRRGQYDRGEIDAEGKKKGVHFSDFAGADGRAHAGSRFEDVFQSVFGQRTQDRSSFQPRTDHPGKDRHYSLKIDFGQAITGTRRRLKLADGNVLDLRIPAGVENRQILRMKGKGDAGVHGGPSGDALVTLRIGEHHLFRRDGDDVRMDLPISLSEAVTGTKLPVDAPSGRVSLTIPAGANSGDMLRLKGKGVQRKNKPGDMLIRLLVVLPRQKEGQEELARFLQSWSARAIAPDR